ncbi:MAG: hypothetical protein SVR94_14340 [Pseudomonadota bacterium]|nr:hypothetical protein [Pseudomonadota bacterium]
MSTEKRFAALQIIQTLFSQLTSQIIEEIKIKDEQDIDKILSEPKFRLNFIQSTLKEITKNKSQQTSYKPQETLVSIKPKNEKKAVKQEAITEEQAELIAEQLKAADSREEGRRILEKYGKTKKRLEVIAKHLKISSISRLNKPELVDKIIQDTIGYRIDSKIIQEHKWDK